MQTLTPSRSVEAVIAGRAWRRVLGWNEMRNDHWEQELDAERGGRRPDAERLLAGIFGHC